MVGPYFIMFGTAVFLITFFFKRRRTGEESAGGSNIIFEKSP